MKYKFVSEDEHKFIIQHPDGSHFPVAKAHVGPEVHKRIKGLEPIKMAEGGEVPDLQESSSSVPTDESAINAASGQATYPSEYENLLGYYKKTGAEGLGGSPETRAEADLRDLDSLRGMKPESLSVFDAAKLHRLEGVAGGTPVVAPAQASTPAPTQPSSPVSGPAPASAQQPILPEQQPAQQPQMQVDPTTGLPPEYANYFKTAMQSNDQTAKAIAGIANANAKEITDARAKEAEVNARYDKELSQNVAEHDALFNAVKDGKIDSNRLWHNMSTGSKIGAAISVLLSGIGAGMQGNGAQNLALKVINDDIDRDVKAQEADLNNKHSLLSDNLRRYGNIQDARRATVAQLWTGVNAGIQARAAQMGGIQALQQGKLAGVQIGLQVMAAQRDLAKGRAEAQSLGYGGQHEGGLPVGQEPYSLLSDPKYQEKRVLVNGRAYQFGGKGEAAQDFRNVESVAGGVTDLVKQLESLGPSATVPGTEANNKAHALRAQLATEIPKLKSMQIGAKRVNDTEAERAEHMVSDPTSFRQLLNGGVRNELFFKTLEDELERGRQQNLIGYRGKQRFKSFKPGV